ncbi:hypothetical protein FLL45_18335 [Aliikangiella marina]|uniref:Uncharacterized protein n=1 Tax=Aliikangiella marina TaxID=1712262 RepID=A0A545T4S9_9GAMM|nr:hypothetical protein [Aliikangiella marina]TQV72178.1 hypothetical protein FLL45_18335 [Aliikangiella marina]
MQSISNIGLPRMQVDPVLDWFATAINEPQQRIFLSYACHRDFLSVPTTHQIIELIGTSDRPALIFPLNQNQPIANTDSEVQQLQHGEYEPGLYQVDNQQENGWFLVEESSIFKLRFSDYNCLEKCYYHLSAEEALDSFLQINP